MLKFRCAVDGPRATARIPSPAGRRKKNDAVPPPHFFANREPRTDDAADRPGQGRLRTRPANGQCRGGRIACCRGSGPSGRSLDGLCTLREPGGAAAESASGPRRASTSPGRVAGSPRGFSSDNGSPAGRCDPPGAVAAVRSRPRRLRPRRRHRPGRRAGHEHRQVGHEWHQLLTLRQPLAQGFVTGATAYILTSVEMDFTRLTARTSRNLTASIWTADGSDEPDSKLVDLTNPPSHKRLRNRRQPVVPMAENTPAIPERRWYSPLRRQ